MSAVVQRRMAAAEMSGTADWMTVAREVQHQVCEEFKMDLITGLSLLRGADTRDPEICRLSVYRRHNHATPCTIAIGGQAINVPVAFLADRQTRPLFDGANPVHIVIAGSFT